MPRVERHAARARVHALLKRLSPPRPAPPRPGERARRRSVDGRRPGEQPAPAATADCQAGAAHARVARGGRSSCPRRSRHAGRTARLGRRRAHHRRRGGGCNDWPRSWRPRRPVPLGPILGCDARCRPALSGSRSRCPEAPRPTCRSATATSARRPAPGAALAAARARCSAPTLRQAASTAPRTPTWRSPARGLRARGRARRSGARSYLLDAGADARSAGAGRGAPRPDPRRRGSALCRPAASSGRRSSRVESATPPRRGRRGAGDLAARRRTLPRELDARAAARSSTNGAAARARAGASSATACSSTPRPAPAVRGGGGKLQALEARSSGTAGYEVNLGSPKQLQELLFEKLGLPPGKKTKTGYSTDAEVLEELAAQHPVAAQILEHREPAQAQGHLPRPAARSWSTRGRGACTPATTRRWPPPAGSRRPSPTCRTSPSAPSSGGEIRRAFIAAARPRARRRRLLADRAARAGPPLQGPAPRRQLPQGRGRPRAHRDRDVRPRERAPTGAAPRRQDDQLRHRLRPVGLRPGGCASASSAAVAKRYIKEYFARYAVVDELHGPAWWPRRAATAARGPCSGASAPCPTSVRRTGVLRDAAERMASNTPIQGTAADILKLAMIDVQRVLDERPRGPACCSRSTTSWSWKRLRARGIHRPPTPGGDGGGGRLGGSPEGGCGHRPDLGGSEVTRYNRGTPMSRIAFALLFFAYTGCHKKEAATAAAGDAQRAPCVRRRNGTRRAASRASCSAASPTDRSGDRRGRSRRCSTAPPRTTRQGAVRRVAGLRRGGRPRRAALVEAHHGRGCRALELGRLEAAARRLHPRPGARPRGPRRPWPGPRTSTSTDWPRSTNHTETGLEYARRGPTGSGATGCAASPRTARWRRGWRCSRGRRSTTWGRSREALIAPRRLPGGAARRPAGALRARGGALRSVPLRGGRAAAFSTCSPHPRGRLGAPPPRAGARAPRAPGGGRARASPAPARSAPRRLPPAHRAARAEFRALVDARGASALPRELQAEPAQVQPGDRRSPRRRRPDRRGAAACADHPRAVPRRAARRGPPSPRPGRSSCIARTWPRAVGSREPS